MITVIIAGGSGTRLWPLSTQDYPKHLLKLTNSNSLLQNTVSRVERLTKKDHILVITEESHVEHVYKQLDNIDRKNILVEPGRRGTASCVLMGLSHIKKSGLPQDEPIIFLWADHLIRDNEGFTASALRAGELSKGENKLVFIGVKPTYPATGFNYIKQDGPVDGWFQTFHLEKFTEKPDKKTAEKYVTSGRYLWNSGYLVGSLSVFENEMKRSSPDLYQDYLKVCDDKDFINTYLGLKSLTIDEALSEKVKDGLVMPVTFDWMDVGSFSDLHAVSTTDDSGNHVWGNNVELDSTTNSYVRNEDTEPVAVIGLDNIVVVNTSNGVLVVNKNYAQNVGEVAKKVQLK
ncbi:mannose-1-phosphate guanylyltransferase [Candidatus Saccharibacteria bacterium]|nr:mannose-1-phosphate guanylyltransferase [Candidatus Saccharibacteria bacterium]MDQ5885153.1 Mannose-phosphate guanylyltransferase [Patescibacteria group bacterium]MDQ5953711.1 Mannose-phosphate guanylyltransferase [Patescibacteria group bacterium]MDQ5958672.1 Mannose-phosphate guanylyltransferase [Patescibacteria group bacterium]